MREPGQPAGAAGDAHHLGLQSSILPFGDGWRVSLGKRLIGTDTQEGVTDGLQIDAAAGGN
jgi:hypothetical protein